MATFFGEVLSVFSRAGEEEEEEELGQPAREVHIQWCPDNKGAIESCTDGCLPCSTLILAVGHNAVGFVKSFVQSAGSWEVVGTVTLRNEGVEGTTNLAQEFPTDSSCLIHRLTSNPTILTYHCSSVMPEDQLFQWTDKVFASLQKRNLNVIVLSNCSLAEYKSAKPVSSFVVPFLRALKTKEFHDTPCCPLLEQPNMITGLPAAEIIKRSHYPIGKKKGVSRRVWANRYPHSMAVCGTFLCANVLSYCQVWHIPAIVYQCYSDITHLDSEAIEAFKPLLSCHSAVPFAKDVSRSSEILKKLLENFNVQSNMYT